MNFMQKKYGIALLSFSGIMGVALACSELPMPPLPPISVTLGDLPKFSDYSNPANAAFMSKLDASASKVLGEGTWVNNSYKGYVAYTFKMLMHSGRNIVYIEKPCGKTAKEVAKELQDQASNNSGGGGGGGGNVGSGSGGGILIGGGCYGSCGGKMPVVDVGPPEQTS
ncbi:hypothetical protein CEK64_00465 [Xanthomonas sontii]|uniref:hypothetical protein n=2 Tax=Xanthomonas TaxID=338 RepID=UPI0009DB44B1|nr:MULTISPECIES: hypothetical protein [Xanthomonas]KAA8921773.1 hypothetical protein CEK64_00465 [Xanthomonas sontii]KAB7773128.1 hypothetical protein CEK69_05075 [Xanthomonas sp. LMG 12462]